MQDLIRLCAVLALIIVSLGILLTQGAWDQNAEPFGLPGVAAVDGVVEVGALFVPAFAALADIALAGNVVAAYVVIASAWVNIIRSFLPIVAITKRVHQAVQAQSTENLKEGWRIAASGVWITWLGEWFLLLIGLAALYHYRSQPAAVVAAPNVQVVHEHRGRSGRGSGRRRG